MCVCILGKREGGGMVRVCMGLSVCLTASLAESLFLFRSLLCVSLCFTNPHFCSKPVGLL